MKTPGKILLLVVIVTFVLVIGSVGMASTDYMLGIIPKHYPNSQAILISNLIELVFQLITIGFVTVVALLLFLKPEKKKKG